MILRSNVNVMLEQVVIIDNSTIGLGYRKEEDNPILGQENGPQSLLLPYKLATTVQRDTYRHSRKESRASPSTVQHRRLGNQTYAIKKLFIFRRG